MFPIWTVPRQVPCQMGNALQILMTVGRRAPRAADRLVVHLPSRRALRGACAATARAPRTGAAGTGRRSAPAPAPGSNPHDICSVLSRTTTAMMEVDARIRAAPAQEAAGQPLQDVPSAGLEQHPHQVQAPAEREIRGHAEVARPMTQRVRKPRCLRDRHRRPGCLRGISAWTCTGRATRLDEMRPSSAAPTSPADRGGTSRTCEGDG